MPFVETEGAMEPQPAATPSSFKPLRIAIVGCGMMTEIAHLPAAMRSPLIELVALVDNVPERATRLKRKYGCSAVTSSQLQEVIDRLDGVVIVTPNNTHTTLATAALQHGISVLVQKPMSTNYADARSLCDLARAQGLVLAVGFQGRHFASVKLMKRLIATGFLGKIANVHCEFGARRVLEPLSGYNLSREQAGGGILVAGGSHYLDRMIYWFGDPGDLRYADDSYGGVESNCKGYLKFDHDICGSFFFSKTVELKNKFEIDAEHYLVELPVSETEQITLFPKHLPGTKILLSERAVDTAIDYWQVELEDFARSIRFGTHPAANGIEAARSVKLCDALYACRTQLQEPWVWYRNRVLARAS